MILRPKEKDLAMELSSIALGSYLILLNRQGPKLVLPRNGDAIRILMQDLLVLIYLSPTNQLSPNWIHWSTCILVSVFQLWFGVLISPLTTKETPALTSETEGGQPQEEGQFPL